MPSLEQPLEMQRPPVVRFGSGQVATLADWVAAAGAERPFVVADKVNAADREMRGADAQTACEIAIRLSFLRRRSVLLDGAVVLACLSAVLVLSAILTLYVGALRDATAASVLFAFFGAALVLTILAIAAFLAEILLAGRGVRVEVERQRDAASRRRDPPRFLDG